jgi:uncharacterized caspase-like protein
MARNLALVIGNSAYEHTTPLFNPGKDASAFAALPRDRGFEVTVLSDATQPDMAAAVGQFAASIEKEDTAVFYYAGPGLQ